TMSIVLAFGFVLGGGFALGDHKSFDPAIPHRFIHIPTSMVRRKYNYVNYSPIAITLAAEENWLTLTVATTAPHPCRRVISIVPVASPNPRPSRRAISTVLAASPAPRPSHKVTSAPAATITAPRHLHEASSAVVIVAPTSASRPLCKAIIPVVVTAVTSASRSVHKTSSKDPEEHSVNERICVWEIRSPVDVDRSAAIRSPDGHGQDPEGRSGIGVRRIGTLKLWSGVLCTIRIRSDT
ncbi:hypothetical protein ACLOJK_037042, partial [Asimina triloba]